jgi:hypothetical protein
MSIVLCRKLNHRNIELHHTTRGESVGVLKRGGEYTYVPWLGFLDRAQAHDRGRPVRLLIARVGRSNGVHTLWSDLRPGQHVQGCMTPKGAYAVTDTDVRVID